MTRSLCGIIFDLDGLLVDSEVYWERARQEYAESVGCVWSPQDEHDAKGCNSVEWARLIQVRCSLTLPLETIIRGVTDRMRGLYARRLPLLPGARQAVTSLAAQWPLALASSSPRGLIQDVLREADLLSYFKVIVSADEVGRGKPAPDVFLTAAQRLGCSGQSVVIFEDSTAGILGARAAGSWVVAVPNTAYPARADALAQADLVLPSLLPVTPALIRELTEQAPA